MFMDDHPTPVDAIVTSAVQATLPGRGAANAECSRFLLALDEWLETNWPGWSVVESVSQVVEAGAEVDGAS